MVDNSDILSYKSILSTFFQTPVPCSALRMGYNVDVIDVNSLLMCGESQESRDFIMRVDSELLGRIFGASVRKERKKRGMKQEFMAESVGYSRSRISEIENGDLPPFEKAVMIVNVLGISLDSVVYPCLVADVVCRHPSALQRLAELSPHEQRLIVEIVQAVLEEMKLVMAPLSA
jgi:transcriptional regulator with XRE-family HTH domain